MNQGDATYKRSFIESQFPVSKVSKESYKERKGAQGQTLTQLGKWWGRKPLILVRAALLGLLLPATENPVKDRDIFLKLLTMDDEGLLQRKNKSIPPTIIQEYLTPKEISQYFDESELRSGLSREEKQNLQQMVFLRMGYDERLKYCCRPEEIDGPSPEAWQEINAHLGTHASSIPELVGELGIQQFGDRPSVGDCFCGGGSVPFEAARMGCDVYASDLNPVAALLTWAALNIIGGGEEVVREVREAQQEVYDEVDRQITEWGIEHNEKGWRGYAYLYCNEVICPECGWKVPLLPSFSVAERMQKVIAELKPDLDKKSYEINIRQATSKESKDAKKSGTITSRGMVCPNPDCPGHLSPIPIATIRRESSGGLRLWENDDIIPRLDDVFQERLYCIRWMEMVTNSSGREETKWHFSAPDASDLQREEHVFTLLKERFSEWREKGYLPSMKIEPGEKTDEPIRTRGWTHWHHLFTQRQLLKLGLLMEYQSKLIKIKGKCYNMLMTSRYIERNSKLCGIDPTRDGTKGSFYNQALNTLFQFGARGYQYYGGYNLTECNYADFKVNNSHCSTMDAKKVKPMCDIWLTDPPYADAINYHELSEFFLAWYDKPLKELFPDWSIDSKRALAITGTGEGFIKSMVEVYANLAQNMPENGAQIVMFTQRNPGVWADLATILWAARLWVSAAWCISTETESSLKKGDHVQGTVLLVLRKQTSDEIAFLDEIYPEVEREVKRQLDSMLSIDDKDDPNFVDTDYPLAAYAAALRVLTRYKQIEDIDIERELGRTRRNGDQNPLEKVIENAVKIACDYLVPKGIDSWIWKQLTPEERFYLKGLELESHGEYRVGAYQELARGFGIRDYRSLQQTGRANKTRLKTASEFRDRDVGGAGFSSSLVRQILFAIRQTRQEENTAAGKVWLREYHGYWERRKDIIAILKYISAFGSIGSMPQWKEDAEAARLLAVVVEQDHL